MNKSLLIMTDDQVVAFGEVIVRSAKGTKHPTVIITIPLEVVNACKLKVGEKIDVITSGKNIVIKCREVKI